MSYYVPARWRTALQPAPNATRILGTDGRVWLVVPVCRLAPDARGADVWVVPEDNSGPAVMWRIDLDAACILAVPTHDEAVAMLLRGFPNAELLAWQVPE